MKGIDKLERILKRQPKINIALMIPEEIINKGYKNVSMTTDGLEFFGCYGILKNKYLFKGKLKVDLEK